MPGDSSEKNLRKSTQSADRSILCVTPTCVSAPFQGFADTGYRVFHGGALGWQRSPLQVEGGGCTKRVENFSVAFYNQDDGAHPNLTRIVDEALGEQ